LESAQIVSQCFNSEPKYTQIKAGLPEDYSSIKTVRDLLEINYKLVGAKEQLRQNLICILNNNGVKYPGIIGYDQDVIPALDRAILSCQDIFLIGQIGQAKTRLVEVIAKHLLSPIPVIEGSITNDTPMDLPPDALVSLLDGKELSDSSPQFHISPESAKKIQDHKLDTKINWIDGSQRFRYVLATPDISVKDLVGYIDAIKVAKKGVEMYKIDSYSPGQLLQAKHGIFCIDELPVLDPRKQVALLSVLQEGRYTTGSYPVIFEPKTVFFATANPIDYTHSGKIIEPLYDRLKSHIQTHYPKTIEDEMQIILQEAKTANCLIPIFVLKTLARLVHNARANPDINQAKGVSVRFGIHGLELVVGESERTRAITHKKIPVPRISDMYCLGQIAKFELSEIDDTIENRRKIFEIMLGDSIKETCLDYVRELTEANFDSIKQEFSGKTLQVSQAMIWQNNQISYSSQLAQFPKLSELVNLKLEQITLEQANLVNIVPINNLIPEQNSKDELKAAILELLLDAMYYMTPKIVDKKETGYVAV